MHVRARIRYVRSLGATTDRDLTGPAHVSHEGDLVLPIKVGQPLVLILPGGKKWKTTTVQTIQEGAAGSHPGSRCEVQTKRSVYEVRVLSAS